VGFGVSFFKNDVGIYLALTGGCLFHAFATAVVGYLLTYKNIRHQKLVSLSLTYTLATLGGFLFLPFSNRDTFLLVS
jgi:hypothetical protein